MAKQADIKKAKIVDYTSRVIQIKEFVDRGSDGLVFLGNYKDEDQLQLAIKFYVQTDSLSIFAEPTRLPRFAEDLKHRYKNELERLRFCSHQNLQKYIACGDFTYDREYFRDFMAVARPNEKIPFIISRYVSGKRLDKLISERSALERNILISYLVDIAKALAYLHHKDRRILHGDVRALNVIIELKQNIPVIVDFGLSKGFTLLDPKNTNYFFIPNQLPDKIIQVLTKIEGDRSKFDREILGKVIFPWLDLYQFGQLIELIIESECGKNVSLTDRSVLRMIKKDLTSWMVKEDTLSTCLGGKISSAEDLVTALSKIQDGVDYYSRQFNRIENRPSRVINRSTGELEIRDSLVWPLAHPAMCRMHNLRQLSLLYYIYPSAGQSRYDHLLSSLARARQIWKALTKDPSFVYLMDTSDIDRLELSALLHDINHFPFLHYFQEAGIKEIENAEIIDTLLDLFNDTTLQNDEPQFRDVMAKRGIDTNYLRDLISPELPIKLTPQDQIIKSIINSGIDIDKLAYLPDDAQFTGAPYGKGVDLFGLLDNIGIAEVETHLGSVWHIVFHEDALSAVESVCFSRYWNFQRIYWHHTNRAIEAMIIWTIREIYAKRRLDPKQYLVETRNLGESGSIEYLSRLYRELYYRAAPIEGLTRQRDFIMRPIYEMPLKDYERIIHEFQNPEYGPENRSNAETRVYDVVYEFLKGIKYDKEVERSEVLLDIPMRPMDLGGSIFIKGYDEVIEPAIKKSSLLKELERRFDVMGKILRVYISPRIREALTYDIMETKGKNLRMKIREAVLNQFPLTEVI